MSPTVSSRTRGFVLDLILGASGLGVGAVSLTYPFGRDQGLYYYVAREWVLRGAIPYRDVLDHKTPGIYVIHAIAIALFGEHMWGIRVLDLVCTVLLGVVAATFTRPRGEPIPAGMRGASTLFIGIVFYAFLNFWDTAQSELWYSMCGLATIWAARRIRRDDVAEVTSGALGAIAMIIKPPAIWFVMIAIGVILVRIWEDREKRLQRILKSAARFSAGFALPLVVLFGYFGSKHALGAMKDIVIGANSYYVTHETSIHDLTDVADMVVDYCRYYGLVLALILGSSIAFTIVHHRRRDVVRRNRGLLGLLLFAAGFAAVAMQKKFYLLHWTVILGPLTVVAANVVRDVIAFTESSRQRFVLRNLAVGVGLLTLAPTPGIHYWVAENRNAYLYLTGKMSHEDYSATFAIPVLGYWFHDSEQVGLWLREHSDPSDTVAVRGFDPEIYVVAHRRYGGRFFWTTFLTSPARAYRRADWLAEENAAFDATKPRFVVTLTDIHEGLDSAQTYYARGYEYRKTFNEFTVLERASAMPTPPPDTMRLPRP